MVVIRHTVLIACGTEWGPKRNLARAGQLIRTAVRWGTNRYCGGPEP